MMQIVEISEPGIFSTQENDKQIAVGIDFGTTNSVIAYSHNGNCELIQNKKTNRKLFPSIIVLSDHSAISCKEAPPGSHFIRSIKRLLAKSAKEIKESPLLSSLIYPQTMLKTQQEKAFPIIENSGQKWNLVQLSAEIFSHLKKEAEEALGTTIEKAVVSVPAYFDAAGRGQIMMAAKLAGFEVLRLIAEPTAAAYAYGLNKNTEGTFLVYDLGGGTFDVSVLEMQTGILQVVASKGDNMLGGDDIDHLLAEYISQKSNAKYSPDLLQIASKAKVILSTQNSANLQENDLNIEITRQEFEEIISPLLNKTIKIAKQAFSESSITKLDGIILVGGSSRIPLITKLLEENFKVKILNSIDPDLAVAMGAAFQAENLTASRNSLLLDVVPLSLGIELYGGIVEKVIMRNSQIPCSVIKKFTTQVDNQTGLVLHIVQGEREMASDCRSLAKFELTNIPKMQAGKPKIEVTFAIDADGILSVTASESTSSISQNIEIKPSFGISEKEIDEALIAAFQNSQSDHELRFLAETRLDAQNLLSGIEKAIKDTPEILTDQEKQDIVNAISSLQNVINLDNREHILSNMHKLNSLARNFIQKHLDEGAKKVIVGQHIEKM